MTARTSRLSSILLKVAAIGALAGCSLAAATGSASAATQSGHDGAQVGKALYSTGFHVNNETSDFVLALNHVSGGGNFDGRPATGAWLRPGNLHSFELTAWAAGAGEHDEAVYDILKLTSDGSGYRVGQVTVDMEDHRLQDSTDKMTGSIIVAPQYDSLQLTFSGDTNYDMTTNPWLTPAGRLSETTIGANDRAGQGRVMALCNQPLATCSYTPTSEVQTIGNWYQVGAKVTNTDDLDMDTTIGGKTTHGVDSSFETSVEAGFEYGPFAAKVSTTFGSTVSTETEVSQDVKITVPAKSTVWLEAASPVTRVTGDFDITVGNTVYHLTDTTMDFPQGATTNFRARVQSANGTVTTKQVAVKN